MNLERRFRTSPNGDIVCSCGQQASIWWPNESLVRWTANHFAHGDEPAWTWWARYLLHPIEDGLAWVGRKMGRRRA